MTKIKETFEQLKTVGRKGFIPFVSVGDPDLLTSKQIVLELAENGADIIELGVPFSDPMADGPTIQLSSQRALANGVTITDILEMVKDIRKKTDVPVVLFSYLNPLLAAGRDVLERAADAGVHGILVTDLPLGADPVREAWLGEGPLAFVRLVAPTTPAARMADIARHGRGFVYLISRMGVTGARSDLPPDLPATVERLRGATTLPICVGFGISQPDQAAAVARLADGVVVGSAIVRAAGESPDAALQLVRELRAGMDGVMS